MCDIRPYDMPTRRAVFNAMAPQDLDAIFTRLEIDMKQNFQCGVDCARWINTAHDAPAKLRVAAGFDASVLLGGV